MGNKSDVFILHSFEYRDYSYGIAKSEMKRISEFQLVLESYLLQLEGRLLSKLIVKYRENIFSFISPKTRKQVVVANFSIVQVIPRISKILGFSYESNCIF